MVVPWMTVRPYPRIPACTAEIGSVAWGSAPAGGSPDVARPNPTATIAASARMVPRTTPSVCPVFAGPPAALRRPPVPSTRDFPVETNEGEAPLAPTECGPPLLGLDHGHRVADVDEIADPYHHLNHFAVG